MGRWKTLIQALSHELNNSLAPLSSTLFSVRKMLDDPKHRPRLDGALDSAQARIDHLADFLGEYASLARMPDPRPSSVRWPDFITRLSLLVSFDVDGVYSGTGWFDAGQIEQVMLNLVKNAEEAGSTTVSVAVSQSGDGFEVHVRDRGQGLSAEAMAHATLPFWSTRADGTGLGLALARDIVVARWLAVPRCARRRRCGGPVLVAKRFISEDLRRLE